MTRRDQDPGILGQTCRDNVGKDHLPAGAGSNLHRPPSISGDMKSWWRVMVWRMSP